MFIYKIILAISKSKLKISPDGVSASGAQVPHGVSARKAPLLFFPRYQYSGEEPSSEVPPQRRKTHSGDHFLPPGDRTELLQDSRLSAFL